jgi:hypothetical protein
VPKGYVGVTIFPFVFLKCKALKEDVVLLNHEKIHLKQQLELLIIPFFVIYGFEFLIRLLQYKRWSLAYRNISFEREAYFQEAQLNYLKHRRLYSFLKYL